MASTSKRIKLKSSDGETFEVEEAVAVESQVIKHIIEDDCAESDIPVPNVTSKILSKALEYCKKRVDAGAAATAAATAATASTAAAATAVAAATTAAAETANAADAVGTAKAPDASAKAAAATASNSTAAAEWAKAAAEAATAAKKKKNSDDELKAWDTTFDQSTDFELMNAANYLNIRSLLDLTCQTVADMIKGKTPEEIREAFNIKNDFTPEEEEEVRKVNQWGTPERPSISRTISSLRKKRRLGRRTRGMRMIDWEAEAH